MKYFIIEEALNYDDNKLNILLWFNKFKIKIIFIN